MKKIVLAYSGGLDTSVAIAWLRERYDAQVVTLTVDIGGRKDLAEVKDRALKAGALRAYVVDGRQAFVQDYIFPALQAGAIYEGKYPLATALSRPFIAKHLVELAQEEGADAVAHGCTGKGNDQVRFEVSLAALAPQLQVLAPAREWGMSREEEVAYARRKGLPLPSPGKSVYSIDENLWGRSIEGGELEDPWAEPPEEAFSWTRPVAQTPEEPLYLEIQFHAGIPVAINGEEMKGVDLIQYLNRVAGEHGVGRIDHLENRLVGIKSRELYEAPAAMVLHQAHRALEGMTLSKEQQRFKERVAQEYADLIYNGLWFTRFHEDLRAYVRSTQREVSGTVRVKLHKGNCLVVGVRAPKGLYRFELATYGAEDQFDHRAAAGFIHIYGLPVKTQARTQGIE